jgi:hypothetical protein
VVGPREARESSRKRYTPEQIIGKLREAELALSAEAVEKGGEIIKERFR